MPMLLPFLLLLAAINGAEIDSASDVKARSISPRSLGGSFSTPVDNGNADARIEWAATQSQTTATSTVRATFYLKKNTKKAKAYTEAPGLLEIEIDGKSSFSGNVTFDFRNKKVGDTDAEVSVSEDVNHTDSSVRQVQISAVFNTNSAFGLISLKKTIFLNPITPKFYVTFYVEGSIVENKTVTYGSIYGTFPKPSRTGYAFAGWFTEDGKQVYSTSIVDSTCDKNLYAQWRKMSYIVSFNRNSGTCTSCSPIKVAYGEAYGTLPEGLSRAGYSFGGWYTGLENNERILPSSIFTASEAQVLHARWDPIIYTVSFNSVSGTTVPAINVAYKSMYGALATPTRTGYTFDGWYTAQSGGSRVTSTSTVESMSSHTLYAHWTANKYTMTLNPNGGSSTVAPSEVTYCNTYGYLPSLTRTGYTFDGWYTSQTGGSRVTSGTTVTTPYAHTLYARWTAIIYTVSFNSMGGSSVSSITVTYGSTYGNLPTTTYDGYAFDGWYTSRTGGSKVTSTTPVTTAGSHTLYAHWTANIYTVSFNSMGGSSVYSTIRVTYGGTYGNLPTTTYDGYTFDGWYTSQTGGSKVTSTTPVTTADSHTLYAHWTANAYIVSLDFMDGSVSSIRVTYGGTYYNLPTPTRTGYMFDGWYTAQSGGSEVTSTTPVTTAGSHTLYAHWTANTYTVSLDFMDGSSVSSIRVTYGGTYYNLPTPTRTGYMFDGWYTSQTGGSKVISTTPVTTASSHTLYAHWTANTYTVSLNFMNGSSVSSIIVTYGSTYGDLETPTYDGYTFDGWYTEQFGGDLITSTTEVTTASSHTLYAHWTLNTYRSVSTRQVDLSESSPGKGDMNSKAASKRGTNPNVYTLCFNANGGSASSSYCGEVLYGYYYSYYYGSFPTPTRTGYTFDGWYTSETGGSRVTSTSTVTTAYAHTLYAHWTAMTCNVIFNFMDGSAESSITAAYGSMYGTLPIPTRTGYTFNGWYTSETGGSLVVDTDLVTKAYDHTLYAQWTANTYTVTFDSGDSTNMTTLAFGDGVNASIPQKTGHLFRGWRDVDNATQYPSGTIYPTRNMYLWADFYPSLCEVLLQSDVVSVKVSEQYGTAIPLPDPFDQKTGHTFVGWTDESGRLWVDVFVVPGDSILREKWKKATYEAVFVASDTSNVTKFVDYDSPIDPPEFSRPRLFIEKWCLSNTNCAEYLRDDDLMPAHDATFYAAWAEIPCTVEISLDACNESDGLGSDAAWALSADGFVSVVSTSCVNGEETAVIEFNSSLSAESFYVKYRSTHNMRYVNLHDPNGVFNISPMSFVTLLFVTIMTKFIVHLK